MEGFKVIEFGNYLAAPLVGCHLRDCGARVICVRRPMHCRGVRQEKEWDENLYTELAEGKEVVEIDLKSKEGLSQAFELVQDADVVIENFRPGVMKRLGLGYEQCASVKDSIVYLSLPGFSSEDEDYKGVQAWEGIMMSFSGVFTDMGLNRVLMGISASFSPLCLASVYGSIFGAYSVSLALYSRIKNGIGDHIEVPLVSALMDALTHNSVQFDKPVEFLNKRQKLIDNFNRFEITPQYTYDQVQNLLDAFYCHYKTLTSPVYVVCPSHPNHQQRLMKLLGVQRDDIEQAFPYERDEKLKIDGIGGIHAGKHSESLKSKFQAAFLTKTAEEWEELFSKHSIPAISHRTSLQWIQSQHCIDSGLTTVSEQSVKLGALAWHHETGTISSAQSMQSRPPLSSKKRTNLCCLQGIKVLDTSNVIAAPTIGKMFARMGAEVIKIDPTVPLYGPDITIVYGLCTNIGKRSVLIDLQSEEGREIFNCLLREVDVLVVNNTAESLRRIRLTADELKKINPNLITVQFDAWGGPAERGNLANHIGYDDNVQAAIGIMERFGGGMKSVEEHAHVGTIDVIAGVAGAFSATCALLKKECQGKITVARTSLAAVGQFLEVQFVCGERGHISKKAQKKYGPLCRGEHSLYSLYKTKDAYAFFVISLVDSPLDVGIKSRLENIFGCSIPDMTSETLSRHISQRTLDEWKPLFHEQEFEVCGLRRLKDWANMQHFSQGDTIRFDSISNHPVGKLKVFSPISIRFRHHSVLASNVSPKYGEYTEECLEKNEIAIRKELIENKIVSCSWSAQYLPHSRNKCPICFENNKLICLSCSHKICCKCAERCQEIDYQRCPFCRKPHNMSKAELNDIVKELRSNYRNWRKGFQKGTTDIEKIFIPKAPSGFQSRTSQSSTSISEMLSSCDSKS